MDLTTFQERITAIYGARDRVRGVEGTFRRLVEEIGELARSLRTRDPASLEEEVSDVLAWVVSLASLVDVDAARAAGRYTAGCPRCGETPCRCAAEAVHGV